MRTSMATKVVMSVCVVGAAAALTACTADAGMPSPPAAAAVDERSMATRVLPSLPSRDDRVAYEEFMQELALMVGDESDDVEWIDGTENGFAGLSGDEERLGIDLYWVGDLPRSVAELIERHPQATTVSVHAAEYIRAEMLDARDAVGDGYDKLDGANGEFFTASPDHHGLGLKVRIRAAESEVSRDQVIAAVAELTDMPVVTVVIGEAQRLIPFPAYVEQSGTAIAGANRR